jgi:hypothetical protein
VHMSSTAQHVPNIVLHLCRASTPSYSDNHYIVVGTYDSHAVPRMSPQRVSRRSSARLSRHASRRWSIAQMVAALHRMVQLGDPVRSAVQFVNGQSHSVQPHLLSRSAVHRMHQSLPPHLLHPETSTEAALLDFVQQLQSDSRAAQQDGPTLLTALEESVLVEYVQWRHDSNASVGAEIIKAAALRLMARRSIEYTGAMPQHGIPQRERETETERG